MAIFFKDPLLLIYLSILCHDAPGLSIFRLRQNQMKPRGCPEYPLSYVFFILDEVALGSINVRLKEDKPPIDVPLVKYFFHEKQQFVKGNIVSSVF